MKRKQGAPRKTPETGKMELLQIRVNYAEKATFKAASDLDGKKLSEWIRDRLRRAAKTELQEVNQPVPFLEMHVSSPGKRAHS